jgi:hypothetical protein
MARLETQRFDGEKDGSGNQCGRDNADQAIYLTLCGRFMAFAVAGSSPAGALFRPGRTWRVPASLRSE